MKHIIMRGKEKLHFLLKRVEEKRHLTPSKQALFLNPVRDLNSNFSEIELKDALTKLQDDAKVLRILKLPYNENYPDPFDIIIGQKHKLTEEDLCYQIKLSPAFDQYLSELESYEEIKNSRTVLQKQRCDTSDQRQSKQLAWSDNFKREGDEFVFGEYGSTGRITSKAKMALLNELFKAQGGWVTVKKLREVTDKRDCTYDYVRQTIDQIQRKWGKELKSHISITSKEDLNSEPKPQEGAYRINFNKDNL